MTDTGIAQLTFKTVLRGYDPDQVAAVLHEMSDTLRAAREESETLSQQHADTFARLEAAESQISDLEEARRIAAPTSADVGARIASMLDLAREEADELREGAFTQSRQVREVAEVDSRRLREESEAESRRVREEAHAEHERVVAEAASAAAAVRAEADRYADQVRAASHAEAEQMVEDARESALSIRAEASREAAARRAEAAAIVESHRAAAASVAEFSDRIHAHADRLAKGQARVAQLSEDEMALIAQQAHEQTERIRTDTEHKLAAVSARRHGIEAQLVAVRELLERLSTDASDASVDATSNGQTAPEDQQGSSAALLNGASQNGASRNGESQNGASQNGASHTPRAAPARAAEKLEEKRETAVHPEEESAASQPDEHPEPVQHLVVTAAEEHVAATVETVETAEPVHEAAAAPASPRFRRPHLGRGSRKEAEGNGAASSGVAKDRLDEDDFDDSFDGEPFAAGNFR